MPLLITCTVALLLCILGLVFVYLEFDKPMALFRRGLQRITKRHETRLDSVKFSGLTRQLAESVNETLDVATAHQADFAPVQQNANIDALLEESDEASSQGNYFGFMNAIPEGVPDAPPPKAAPALPPQAPPPATPPITARAPSIPQPPVPQAAPPAPAHAVVPSIQAPSAAIPPIQGNSPPPAPMASVARGAPPPPKLKARPPMPQKPQARFPTAAKPASPLGTEELAAEATIADSHFPFFQEANDDLMDEQEGVTIVSAESENLLAAIRQTQAQPSQEEQHFREVFKNFVATKERCQEPVDTLNYEKFRMLLKKNVEQIKSQYGTSKVRFRVYIKEGKAAIKATPYSSA